MDTRQLEYNYGTDGLAVLQIMNEMLAKNEEITLEDVVSEVVNKTTISEYHCESVLRFILTFDEFRHTTIRQNIQPRIVTYISKK